MKTKAIKDATILVVDDNPTNLNVISEYLADSGFTVLLKKDGEKALSLMKRKIPDLILLDIVMPVMDGYETCRRLKEKAETKDIPVIFMTALADTPDKIKGFEVGAVDYITKPFQHEEVLARVKAHLTIQILKTDLQAKNKALQESLERERKLMEDLRLNLSLSLPHELRTPLNSVIGFSGFLTDARRLPEPDKITEYGKTIYENGLRLNRLVENALLYANLRLLKYAPSERTACQSDTIVDAESFITSVARQKAKAAHRKDDLILDMISSGIRISSKNFEKILGELLENAFKFSEPGTPVQIKLTLNGKLCMLSITDQGIGMTKEQIESIGAYMQFERERHEQQGSGLGLIIAHLLTQLEGGVLSIDSEAGVGTTVSMVLNCEVGSKKADASLWFESDDNDICKWLEKELSAGPKITGYNLLESSPEQTSDTDQEGNRVFRILVIDEKAENRMMMKRLLSPLGFEVIEASDYHDGADYASEYQPSLIFVEASILDEDGFEIMRQLKYSSASGQIMILISDDPSAVKENNLMGLCDDYLIRPLRIQSIFEKLEVFLGLEWIYDETPSELVPKPSDLKQIQDLVQSGYITKVYKELDRIEASDPQYTPFLRKIRRLADAFQMNHIREIIRKHL